MAGESRQTQVVAGVNRIGSDSAIKVFDLADTVLAATAGWAFLQPQGATIQRNISSLIEDFKPTIPGGSGVQAIATLLWAHFNTIYQQHIAQLPASAVPAGQVALNFIVAGYDPGSRTGTLFSVEVPSPTAPITAVRTTNSPGSWWIGQTDVVARIINGFDPRTMNLPFVQAVTPAGTAMMQLDGLSYAVYWNTMTIQDAIDFAVGMIQITTTIQRFTAGIATQLGAVAGVGGPIDVAVVRPGASLVMLLSLSVATQIQRYREIRFTRRSGMPISKLIVAWSHALAFALSWIALLSVSGCVIVPVRLPTQTKDVTGEPKKLDFTFLKSGSTTKGEVTKNLAAIDTGVNQNDFFWGRWNRWSGS